MHYFWHKRLNYSLINHLLLFTGYPILEHGSTWCHTTDIQQRACETYGKTQNRTFSSFILWQILRNSRQSAKEYKPKYPRRRMRRPKSSTTCRFFRFSSFFAVWFELNSLLIDLGPIKARHRVVREISCFPKRVRQNHSRDRVCLCEGTSHFVSLSHTHTHTQLRRWYCASLDSGVDPDTVECS